MRLAAFHCTHPDLDGTDKALLAYLAEYAKPDGMGAYPGNRNIASALGLKDSATDKRIAKNIALGLIERTERANGRNRASAYRLCLESAYYPDETPGGERLVKKVRGHDVAEKPPGMEDAVYGEIVEPEPPGLSHADCVDVTARCDDENRPVNQGKPPGEHAETARSGPTANKYTTNTQPPHTHDDAKADTGGRQPEIFDDRRWREFVSSLPAIMQTASMGKHKAEIEKQIEAHGADKVASAIQIWVRNRDLPLDTLHTRWAAWITEGPEYLDRSAEDIKTEECCQKAINWVFNYYVKKLDRNPSSYVLTPERERLIRDRHREFMKTEGSVEKAANLMADCIDAMTRSDWHMGRNPKTNGKTYNELENCFAPAKFQQWVNAVRSGHSDDGDDCDYRTLGNDARRVEQNILPSPD